ncbi:MAG: 5-formyltetrahydrofolate cyclo-ligase [Brotaphodocola sp.]
MTERKKKIRSEVKRNIEGLSKDYCVLADHEIRNQVKSFQEYQNANTIFCFVGTQTEIDTTSILEDVLQSGKRLGVPKCIGKGIMEVFEIQSLEDLVPGKYGILEPREGVPLIRSEEIDLALVPCLSCNKKGWRLGYGGGFYDRYLADIKAVRAVLCRSRLMRDDIPVELYDLNMDYVITEEGIISVE